PLDDSAVRNLTRRGRAGSSRPVTARNRAVSVRLEVGGFMNRYALVFLAALSVLSGSARAAEQTDARPRDIQRLQEDVANLDAQLAALEAGDRRADEFRTRGEEIK